MDSTLTEIQAQLLEAIQQRLESGEPLPTYRELCAEFGWSSTGTVRDHLRALARKGYVQLSGPGHRRVRIRKPGATAATVPVVGRVLAGVPVLSEENFEGQLSVPREWAAKGKHFALRVRGDSMTGAGIFEGDYVVVRQQQTAQDGDIVVAIVEGQATLKRLRHSRGEVSLVAENPRYRPIQVHTESDALQGVVFALLRRYGRGAGSRLRSRAFGRAETAQRAGRSGRARS